MTKFTSAICGSDRASVELVAAADGEAELLGALRAGHPQAHEALVRQYGPYMLAVARRLLKCEQDRADAVQDAFIFAFEAIHEFSGRATIRTWLHRIIVNACLMRLRATARRPVVSIEALYPRFDETGHQIAPLKPWVKQPAEIVIDAELRDQVRSCIDQLPDTYRTVLMLRDIEEFNTDQTAQLLGVSVAVVKTRLHRARQALRTLLEPLLTA